MKTRNGFVSNSSSSSFIALVPKDEWSNIIATLNPIEMIFVEKLTDDISFCGIDCVEYGYVNGNYDTFEFIDWEEEQKVAEQISISLGASSLSIDDLQNIAYNVRDKIDSMLDKLSSNKIYTHSEDF